MGVGPADPGLLVLPRPYIVPLTAYSSSQGDFFVEYYPI